MQKNNFILSFFTPILCIYLLHAFWSLTLLLLLNKFDYTWLLNIIEFLSPFISYWFLKKYFSNDVNIRQLFLNYASVKNYAVSLFIIELFILLLMFIKMSLASVIYIYLFFLIHYFSFVWYLPFLIMAFINRDCKSKL